MTCRLQETGVLPIRHRKFSDRKGTQPNLVHRLLILLSGVAAHKKRSCWDAYEIRVEDERRVIRTED